MGSRKTAATVSSTAFAERVDVAERDVLHPAGHRLEGRPVGFLRRERQRTHGPAVEGALERDDPGPGLAAGLPGGRPEFRRASLKAASLASVPEFVKKTFEPAGALLSASSFSARAICVGLVKKLETCPSVASWLAITEVTNGWAWPRALTAMPPSRSRYSLPSASQTRQPAPRTRTRCGVPKTPISEDE